LEVVQEFPAPSHELEKPAARRVVFLVDLEVLREHLDSLSEESNLNFGGAGVFVVELVLLDNIFLLIRVHNHRLITSCPKSVRDTMVAVGPGGLTASGET